MLKITVQNIGCMLIAVALATTSQAQTWTETVYAITSPPTLHSESLSSFAVSSSQRYQWGVSQQSWFMVTGSATQLPPWRNLFASICNNTWWFNKDFDFTAPSDGTVTNMVRYTTRTGENVFSGVDPTASASRELSERLVEDLYAVFTPVEQEPPGGGN